MSDTKLDTDEIYELLKKRIINLEYEPGLVLNEVDIADEFNISRTPVRKIFHQLHNDKLLNIIPRFGAQVPAIDFKQMKHVFELTRELDPFATRLAVERISEENIKKLEEIIERLSEYELSKDHKNAIIEDERFHTTILVSCGNLVAGHMTSLHYHTERLWHYCEQFFDDMELFTRTLERL